MKRYIKPFGLHILIISLFSSCGLISGGVIGNIQKYNYEVPIEVLINTVDSAYKLHPEWIPPKSEMYKFDGETYKREDNNFYLYSKEDNVVLKFGLRNYDSLETNTSTITLLTGAQFGEVMELAPRMEYKTKWRFKAIFNRNLIKEVDTILSKK